MFINLLGVKEVFDSKLKFVSDKVSYIKAFSIDGCLNHFKHDETGLSFLELKKSVKKAIRKISKESYYNYRTENNNDSVTGIIQNNKVYYTNKTKPPNKKSKEFIDYILNFNQYFQNNIRIYLHDTYLRTIVGCPYDKILKMELLNNYDILEYIDINNINKLKNLHEYLLEICKELYEIQI